MFPVSSVIQSWSSQSSPYKKACKHWGWGICGTWPNCPAASGYLQLSGRSLVQKFKACWQQKLCPIESSLPAGQCRTWPGPAEPQSLSVWSEDKYIQKASASCNLPANWLFCKRIGATAITSSKSEFRGKWILSQAFPKGVLIVYLWAI